VALVRGTLQLYAGDLPTAVEYFEEALDRFAGIGARGGQMWALIVLGLARGLTGDPRQGFAPLEACIRESVDSGDVWWRSFAMWALGLLRWRAGDIAGGAALEKQSLELKKRFEDEQFVTALCLETLAWIAASERRDERAVRLLGAAEHIWQAMRASLNVFVGLRALHEACVAQVRSRLGDAAYEAAYRDGRRMSQEAALDFALEKTPTTAAPTAGAPAATTPLTRREREIADLVAEGMSNREIAAKLVIAQRTAEGHVEHILSKLGFTSRVQVAAWVAEQRGSAADD
jgi:non-specific serine/threonine protein kinase